MAAIYLPYFSYSSMVSCYCLFRLATCSDCPSIGSRMPSAVLLHALFFSNLVPARLVRSISHELSSGKKYMWARRNTWFVVCTILIIYMHNCAYIHTKSSPLFFCCFALFSERDCQAGSSPYPLPLLPLSSTACSRERKMWENIPGLISVVSDFEYVVSKAPAGLFFFAPKHWNGVHWEIIVHKNASVLLK